MPSSASVFIALTLAGAAVAFSPAAYIPMSQKIASAKQSTSLIASRALPLRKESSISHQVNKTIIIQCPSPLAGSSFSK
jgi:hypothetical protein